jgi:hypothetical protein
MFGVVDHCGVLKEGEVYINIRGPRVGPVAVMRNPAYDPAGALGLIRVFSVSRLSAGRHPSTRGCEQGRAETPHQLHW